VCVCVCVCACRHNNEKSFLIWINEEDQVRVISMQKGGDVKAVFERFGRGLREVFLRYVQPAEARRWVALLQARLLQTRAPGLRAGRRCHIDPVASKGTLRDAKCVT